MSLPVFCIRRPIFTIVLSAVMTIIGLLGFLNLPLRWIPNITPPQVSIQTSYTGANAHLVERDVTKVIEDALSGIDGVESFVSASRQGQSQISITFKLGRNMDAAVEDVRSSLEQVRGRLPKDADNPLVLKANTNNDPVLFISFYNQHLSARELSDYVDKYIVPTFETLDGMGSVVIYGKRVSAIQIKLDPAKMAAANVTVEEVTQLLRDQNASVPSGQIRGNDRFYSVLTDASLKTPEQFNDLIIRDKQNQIIRLHDIGVASIDAEDKDASFRVNGRPGLALGFIPQSNANPLEVEASVKRAYADLLRTLPSNFQTNILYDQADYIRASIHSVYEALIEAVVFVWLVILIFLGNVRATFIPIVTIPVCLVTTFALLFVLHFSINTITLMAFVLAIGLVVDDAIVMLENISRHIENGMPPFEAAIKGSQEMVFPIIAMTITLAAVYAPIAFTPGLLGVLFKEFTFTLAGAVLISGVVALTLSPMMCARLLKSREQQNRYHIWFEEKLSALQHYYHGILQSILQKRKLVLLALSGLVVVGGLVYHFVPAELAPAEDMGEIHVHVGAPRGASYQYTDRYVKELEAIYASIPDINSYLVINHSASRSYHILGLKPKQLRVHTTEELIGLLTSKANQISGVRTNIFAPPPPLTQFIDSDDGDNLGLVMMTSADYRQLQSSAQSVLNAVKDHPGFVHADHNLKWDSEQFQVNIDRNRAADLNVSVPVITNTLSTLLAGRQLGKTDDMNVFVKMNDVALADPNIFHEIYVRSANNQMIALSSLLTIKEVTSSDVLHHYNRMRADTLYLSLAPDFKMADAVAKLQKVTEELLPDNIRYTFTGDAKNFLESNSKTILTFGLALLFIYLILAAQFESLVDPFIILLTVPFAIIGAVITLKLFNGTLNVYSNIGLITLIGLIAKHGILMTEFANQQRREGKSINEAITQAALLRLRPILMTTAAMVLGALPLVLAAGPGAESRQQIGLVITGGLLFGTFFSLIVIPVAYTYLSSFRRI